MESTPLWLVALVTVLLVTPTTLFVVRRVTLGLHMLQLDSYLNVRLLKWLCREPATRLLDVVTGAALVIVAGLVHLAFPHDKPTLGIAIVWCIVGVLWFQRQALEPAKKPLVFTARARRIFAIALLVETLLFAMALGFFAFANAYSLFYVAPVEEATTAVVPIMSIALLSASFVAVQCATLAVVLSNILLAPFQWSINRYYLEMAKRKIKKMNPTTIGIAGSYGKTSTKYFLERIISGFRPTLKTPLSYNTLMGLSRVINESLTTDHKLFIAELGEYLPGDITELADLVQPKIGILTAIGPQHLERFKTMENIERTMFELVEALPSDGTIVLNADDEVCRKFISRTGSRKTLLYGVDAPPETLSIWAEDIILNPDGMEFTICVKSGEKSRAKTGILGRHNVRNILACAVVAHELGMPLPAIAHTIGTLEPAPHRLQLMRGSGGATIIDDSYNSNPVGSSEALEVLRRMQGNQKILVTPGMVELGSKEAELNERFGQLAAQACNHVILVGPKQTEPIQRGLRKAGFAEDRIYIVSNLGDATAQLGKIVQNGDVVLFENDLPDLYAEK